MNKYLKLVISILVDLIGMTSYVFPIVGEISDTVWAPISSLLLFLMFRGKEGAVGSVVNLFEEFSPGFDYIPTLTLTWFFVYVKNKKPKVNKPNS